MTDLHINRRDAVTALLAISASGALAACSDTAADIATTSDPLRYASATQFFSTHEMARIAAIADTIIPTTDTPGAVAAGVPDTLQGLASSWGDDDFRRYWRGGIETLGNALNAMAGEDFVALSPEAREATLAAHDTKVYAGEVEDGFYRDFKRTVATAYYMSEPGATEELAYEAVPGEWIGDAPVSRFPKTWAT